MMLVAPCPPRGLLHRRLVVVPGQHPQALLPRHINFCLSGLVLREVTFQNQLISFLYCKLFRAGNEITYSLLPGDVPFQMSFIR